MRYAFSILLLALSMVLCAQAPALIPYQAVVRDAVGQPLANANVNARFTIHDGTANGASVWQELQTVSTSALGLFTVQLGSSVSLNNVNWASGAKFMQVEVDLGSGFVEIGNQQMLSVPYALYAGESGNGFSHIGPFGDTLFFNNGSYLVVPGIAAANPDANSTFGCTDSQACNYSAAALYDNNSCQYVGGFCNDGDALTVNDSWTVDCVCEGVLTVPGATHYCGAQNVHNADISYGTMTDQDGNLYKTVIIGTQEWMAENLRTTHYRNGDPIQNIPVNTDWDGTNVSATGAWCYYNNDVAFDCPYGKLYNYYATVDSDGLCPFGWHIPTDSEWDTLINFLDTNANGGSSTNTAGGFLKSAGTYYWSGTNTGGNNSVGFAALPGGYRNYLGIFSSTGILGYYWSRTGIGSTTAYSRVFGNSTSSVTRNAPNRREGQSVRCVRD